MLQPELDHEGRALSRVALQYRSASPGVPDLVRIFAHQVQELEDAAHQVRAAFHLDDAIGLQLDWLGKTVGELRQGRDDDTYRSHIRARLILNRGSGEVPTLLRLFRALEPTGRVQVKEYFPAAVLVSISGREIDATAQALLLGFLRAGKAGGVRALLEYSTAPDADAFTFDGPGVGLGFGSTADPAIGGRMSGITS